jgi:cytochrome b6-f complex iron-sulfur subunit
VSTSRRGFLRGVAGVGAGAAATGLTGCAPNISPAPVANADKDPDGRVRLVVSQYPDLAREGGAITLRVPGEQNLLVTHPEADTYAVVSSTCTHSGCPLAFEQGEIVCPCHLSRFDLEGKVTNPPAQAPLTAFVARYDAGKGVLLIDFKAGDTDFPVVVDGKLFFPFSLYPELKTAGGVAKGVPEGYGRLLFVFALEGGTYSAVDGICTHLQCLVTYDEPVRGLWCRCHNSRFTTTGEVTRGPDPSGAPNIPPLTKFTVTSDASGVTVAMPEP